MTIPVHRLIGPLDQRASDVTGPKRRGPSRLALAWLKAALEFYRIRYGLSQVLHADESVLTFRADGPAYKSMDSVALSMAKMYGRH